MKKIILKLIKYRHGIDPKIKTFYCDEKQEWIKMENLVNYDTLKNICDNPNITSFYKCITR